MWFGVGLLLTKFTHAPRCASSPPPRVYAGRGHPSVIFTCNLENGQIVALGHSPRGDLQHNEGCASIFSKTLHTLNSSGIRLWRPALGASRARAPEPPNKQIRCIYLYLGPKCRQIVEFMAFGACQTPQARRPWRTSQPEWYSPLVAGSWGLAGAPT